MSNPTDAAPTPQAAGAPIGVFVGLATLDLIQHVSPVPAADAKATASWQQLCGGGPALNAAVTFAALGGRATLVTRLGRSPVADLVRADLAAHAVTVVDMADRADAAADVDAAPDGATETAADDYALAVSAIAVDPERGTRQIVSTDAGRVRTPCDRLPAQVADLVTRADVVLLDGHHPDLAVASLSALDGGGTPEAAAPRGTAPSSTARVPVVLDAGRWKPAMAGILPSCTDVICSDAFRLPDPLPEPSSDPPAATSDPPDGVDRRPRARAAASPAGAELAGDDLLAALLRGGARLAAISNGPYPLRWRTVRSQPNIVPVPSIATWGTGILTSVPEADREAGAQSPDGPRTPEHDPLDTGEVWAIRDTLGAGDVLHGAYAWARARLRDEARDGALDEEEIFHRCLSLAAGVASLSCSRRGTRSWLAELDADLRAELDSRLGLGGDGRDAADGPSPRPRRPGPSPPDHPRSPPHEHDRHVDG